jgi:nicotinate-nucleotide adenylyltransferase
MTQPRLALFGGTFDPVHVGHLLLAESARAAFHLDRVLFVPTGIPPHKPAASASNKNRLAMLRLALRGNRAFRVYDWEIRQKRQVYSYETIAQIKKRYPRAELFFIGGSDMLRTIPSWKMGRALLDSCTFLVAERPDCPLRAIPADLRRKSKRIEWPAVPFASHAIRKRVSQKKTIRYQVPESVERYIYRHHLYS